MKQASRSLPTIRNKSTGIIHEIVGVTYKNCSATWKRLKQEIVSNGQKKQDFIKKVQNATV